MVTLRPYRPDDAPALLALFRDTIRRVNSRDYSPAQIAAWASDDIDPGEWCGRFAGRFVVVAEDAGRPVGFAELEPDGHIDRVYVAADYQGQGIGRQLLAAVVAEARRVGLVRLFTEASITARPFFESPGVRGAGPAGGDLSRGRVRQLPDGADTRRTSRYNRRRRLRFLRVCSLRVGSFGHLGGTDAWCCTVDARVERIAMKLRTAARGKVQPFGVETHGFRRRRVALRSGRWRRSSGATPSNCPRSTGRSSPAWQTAARGRATACIPWRRPSAKSRAGECRTTSSARPSGTRRAYNPYEDPKLASFWRRVEDGEIEEDEEDRRMLYQAAGTLVLCHEGCGILHLLVVTGPSRGQMWVDDRCNDQGLFPLGVGFFDWYERWLDNTLAGGNGVWWHSDV